MYGRNGKQKLVLVLLAAVLCPASAAAKQLNFATGLPFGFGFQAGISRNAQSRLIDTPMTKSSDVSPFYAVEPFFDFGNFQIRLTAQLHPHTVFAHRGTDSTGTYNDDSDANGRQYGGYLLLMPWVSDTNLSRLFLKGGYTLTSVTGENKRTYVGGSPVRTEHFKGAGHELLLGMGFEFFFVQNYSLSLEGGYRKQEITEFTYSEAGTDLDGNTKAKGDPLLNGQGERRKFDYSGAYGAIGFNLNF